MPRTMASGSHPQYRCSLIEGVEKVEDYRPGGFCPIIIGQILEEKYEIIAKLGYGGHSTVWLARSVTTDNIWVAIKVLKSDKSEQGNSELAIHRSIRQANIIQYLDDFWIQSPNGFHLCLVMEVTGPSIYLYVESLWNGKLDVETAIDLSRQCVKALIALHNLGYAHGDVCSANFAVGLSDISHFVDKSMDYYTGYQTGAVWSEANSPLPAGVPERLYESVPSLMNVDLSSVKMIDFGEAFSGMKKGVATHASYRAPELLADEEATVQSDIWSMGCLIFELMTSQSLFVGNLTTVAGEQLTFFARPPKQRYEYLIELLSEHSVLEYEEENDWLANLLSDMLVQDRQGRMNLGLVLEHDFFKFAGQIGE